MPKISRLLPQPEPEPEVQSQPPRATANVFDGLDHSPSISAGISAVQEIFRLREQYERERTQSWGLIQGRCQHRHPVAQRQYYVVPIAVTEGVYTGTLGQIPMHTVRMNVIDEICPDCGAQYSRAPTRDEARRFADEFIRINRELGVPPWPPNSRSLSSEHRRNTEVCEENT